MKIYLVRHGETDWNKMQLLQGREDIPLNETGISQALICGEAFAHIPIDRIISSPLIRAQKTASLIRDRIGSMQIEIEPELIERDFGLISGMNKEQRLKFQEEKKDPKAESFDTLCDRAYHTIQTYAKNNHAKNLLMVSHGAFIGAALTKISNGKIDANTFRLLNTSINIFEFKENKLSILDYNISPKQFLKAELQS